MSYRVDLVLTSDNVHLSEVRNSRCSSDKDRLGGSLGPVADRLLEAAISFNTRRAYRADLEHFLRCGGSIPTIPENIVRYLSENADVLAISTLARRLVSIGKAHTSQGMPNPVSTDLVRHAMRGVRRLYGKPQRQATAAVKSDILAMCAGLGDRLKDKRDLALILIGFAGAFRRSELSTIDCACISWEASGIVVLLARSKTDQEGMGRKVAIPYGRGTLCPVKALKAWLEASGIEEGPIFRSINRHGRIDRRALTGEAVASVVKERAFYAGLDPTKYSGHSLRAGLATSAAAAGVQSWKIRAQTGHKSDAMLSRYIREGQLFQGNAAGAIL